MKTSFELAMERLNKSAPSVKLTPGQKQQLAELDSKGTAKIAELEIAIEADIAAAGAKGETDKVEQLRQRLASERKAILAGIEEKKEKVRLENPSA